jgi:hypothetical protein
MYQKEKHFQPKTKHRKQNSTLKSTTIWPGKILLHASIQSPTPSHNPKPFLTHFSTLHSDSHYLPEPHATLELFTGYKMYHNFIQQFSTLESYTLCEF